MNDMVMPQKQTVENPICLTCGYYCTLSRQEIWKCTSCDDYTISKNEWDIIMRHANAVHYTLSANGIESMLFRGIPIAIEDACMPSHLLPLFVMSALKIASAVGLKESVAVSITQYPESADEAGTYLIDFATVVCQQAPDIAPSLTHITSATLQAIAKFRDDDAMGVCIPSEYVYE